MEVDVVSPQNIPITGLFISTNNHLKNLEGVFQQFELRHALSKEEERLKETLHIARELPPSSEKKEFIKYVTENLQPKLSRCLKIVDSLRLSIESMNELAQTMHIITNETDGNSLLAFELHLEAIIALEDNKEDY